MSNIINHLHASICEDWQGYIYEIIFGFAQILNKGSSFNDVTQLFTNFYSPSPIAILLL